MGTVVKTMVVFVVGLVVSLVAGLLYGVVAHYFDLFIVFPFVVTGIMVGICSSLARRLRFNAGAALLVIGLLIGVVAYVTYLGSKYAMLVSEFANGVPPAQLTDFVFSVAHLQAVTHLTRELFMQAQPSADAALRARVGEGGVLGQMLLNMQEGIPWQTGRIGVNNAAVGAVVELFKIGVLTIVTGTALRDTVRREAFLGFSQRRARSVGNRREP